MAYYFTGAIHIILYCFSQPLHFGLQLVYLVMTSTPVLRINLTFLFELLHFG